MDNGNFEIQYKENIACSIFSGIFSLWSIAI